MTVACKREKRQLPNRSGAVYLWYLTQNVTSGTSLSKSFPVEIIYWQEVGHEPVCVCGLCSFFFFFVNEYWQLSHKGECLLILLRLNLEYEEAWELSTSAGQDGPSNEMSESGVILGILMGGNNWRWKTMNHIISMSSHFNSQILAFSKPLLNWH